MKTSYLLLFLLIASSIEYPYEYIKDENIEDEPILGIKMVGLITGFIKGRINSLKDPNFWINLLGKQLKNQIQKWANSKSEEYVINAIIECDKRINKENNDQVIAIRKEVGLPLDTRAFCYKNPECGTKIKNDYDYLDYKIFNLPPYDPFSEQNNVPYPRIPQPGQIYKRPSNDPKYLAARAKVDRMYEILKKMDENFHRCIDNPFILIN